MRRIGLVLVLMLSLTLAPHVIEAQQAGKMYRVGVLSPEAHPPGLFEAFTERLHELGYAEGKNIVLESRQAEGRHERLPVLAKELVRLRVDVIVAVNTPAVQAAKNATTEIPIVMSRISDPVKTGLIPSFSRPGGNVTGLSFQPEETSVKRLQLLKEAVPSVSRVAALWDTANPGPGMTIRAIEPARIRVTFLRPFSSRPDVALMRSS
jgi:putative ABC transport system substrate-binding protein